MSSFRCRLNGWAVAVCLGAVAFGWGAVASCGCRSAPFYRMTSKASKSLPLSREGIAAYERGNLALAEERLAEAVELNGSDVETCRYYGETLWRRGKRREAIDALTAAAEKKSTVDVEISLYRSLGEKALETDEPLQTIVWANKIVDASPKSADGWALRGTAYRRLGRSAEALNDFQRAVHFATDDRELLAEIATIQSETGDFESSLATWQHLERLYPANREPAAIFAGEGDAYRGLGRLRDAQDSFAVAVRNDPNEPAYRRRFAEAALARGDVDRALAALDEALQLAPGNVPCRELRDSVLAGRTTPISIPTSNPNPNPIETAAVSTGVGVR